MKLDLKIVGNIFKKIKRKGILDKPIYEKAIKLPSKELLESNNLIDKIIYYRMLKGMSMLALSNKAGVCDTTYRNYEHKKFEIQDWEVAEKLLDALDIKDKVQVPDSFKIKKNYPMDKIIEMIKEYGKEVFSERTGICLRTINTWLCKGAPNQIANSMYEKMVKLFKEDNIKFDY